MHYDHFALQINHPSRDIESRLQRQNWTLTLKAHIQLEAKVIRKEKETTDLRESDVINLNLESDWT